jgi:hypothetical protein
MWDRRESERLRKTLEEAETVARVTAKLTGAFYVGQRVKVEFVTGPNFGVVDKPDDGRHHQVGVKIKDIGSVWVNRAGVTPL